MLGLALALAVSFNISVLAEFKSLRINRQKTPISTHQLAIVIRDGHQEVFGRKPNDNRLAMAWSQIALENGQGAKIFNYNLGFVHAGPKQPYFFVGGYKFKANRDFMEGATLYWKTIKKNCSGALPYFDAGNSDGAARKLGRCGYYRINPDIYAKGMNSLFRKARKEILPKL